MAAPENPIKSAMSRGDVQFGVWLSTAHPTLAEIAAHAGFDWCLIDGEHAPNDIPLILAQLQAMNGAPASPALRLPVGDVRLVKQALDLGVQTLLIPMVNSADEARAMVAAVRYPPRGVRGVGASVARAARFGAVAGYVTSADEQICLIVQVETLQALVELDAIASVDGVDCVFLGPADLAASLGHPGNAKHLDVQSVIADAAARITQSGKAVGMITFDPDDIGHLRDMGATFIAVGSDASLLSRALHDRAALARGILRP